MNIEIKIRKGPSVLNLDNDVTYIDIVETYVNEELTTELGYIKNNRIYGPANRQYYTFNYGFRWCHDRPVEYNMLAVNNDYSKKRIKKILLKNMKKILLTPALEYQNKINDIEHSISLEEVDKLLSSL